MEVQVISLLVPCYNASGFIDAFLNNIAKQTRPFDEVLFYDDASTDNTVELLTAKGYKVIKGETNKGPAFARNTLALTAKGTWFHFHDIDDFLVPLYLEKTVAIAATGNYDVILCNVDWYDTDQKNIMISWKYSNSEINANPVAYTITHPIGGINGLYRKEKFITTGGFNTDLRIWEDADLHVKLAENDARFHVIEEVLSIAIRYHNSASANQSTGWLTRLGLLSTYCTKFSDKDIRTEIGRQAQLAASGLIILKEYNNAIDALKLSEHCGLKVPDSNNPAWRILHVLLPGYIRIKLRMIQLKHAFKKNNNG